jgi:hypothetical protein
MLQHPQNACLHQLLVASIHKQQELIMANYFESADGVFRIANNHNSDPSNPRQQCATAGTFALRRALYFQRNILSFQSEGTEGPYLYKTATEVHELFP